MYGDGDFFSMKGVIEEFFDKVGMHGKETYDPQQASHICIRGVRLMSFTTEPLWDISEKCIQM